LLYFKTEVKSISYLESLILTVMIDASATLPSDRLQVVPTDPRRRRITGWHTSVLSLIQREKHLHNTRKEAFEHVFRRASDIASTVHIIICTCNNQLQVGLQSIVSLHSTKQEMSLNGSGHDKLITL